MDETSGFDQRAPLAQDARRAVPSKGEERGFRGCNAKVEQSLPLRQIQNRPSWAVLYLAGMNYWMKVYGLSDGY
ncbi:MAG: hypothetical protein A2063_09245 [Gallionellales bacterium GWA2_60_142]|nr:MAG: hypothetical protein A2063_09245 [Gallionellales bacterium GWA2_60_142]